MFFSCAGNKIDQRIADVSLLAADLKFLPPSLGLRTQTQKLKFVTPDMQGSFLKSGLTIEQAIKIIEEKLSLQSPPPEDDRIPPHRAFIGEAVSLIYAPYYLKKGVFYDAIVNEPVAKLQELEDGEKLTALRKHDWLPDFLPTLCPNCGWDLAGSKASLVLTCRHCDSIWAVTSGRLQKLDFSILPIEGTAAAFLPFWRIRARVEGLELNTYADLVRLANLPRVIKEEWREQDFFFWIPAFKIQPQTFLRLSRLVTVAQPGETEKNERIGETPLYPVSLPLSEARQSLKVNLANLTVAKKKLISLLPGIEIEPVSATLFFLPFTSNGREFVWPGTQIAISKNILDYGREI